MWSDGRIYRGYWENGKQHGLGRFLSKDGKVKYGLWDEGKKLKWLT